MAWLPARRAEESRQFEERFVEAMGDLPTVVIPAGHGSEARPGGTRRALDHVTEIPPPE